MAKVTEGKYRVESVRGGASQRVEDPARRQEALVPQRAESILQPQDLTPYARWMNAQKTVDLFEAAARASVLPKPLLKAS
jgi:hypothetical protein